MGYGLVQLSSPHIDVQDCLSNLYKVQVSPLATSSDTDSSQR